jgi:hypothetical protein
MPNVLILTDRTDFAHAIVRGEPLPDGVKLNISSRRSQGGGGRWLIKVDLRLISGSAFSLWLLRKVRSIGGNHQIEIGGAIMPQHMPEAIDIVAEAVVNAKRRLAA